MKALIILIFTFGITNLSFGRVSTETAQSRERFQLALAGAELQAINGEISIAAKTLEIVIGGLNKTNYRPKTKVAILKKFFEVKASIEVSLDDDEKRNLETAVFEFRRSHPELTQYL